jgi:hypothetical protein
LGRESLVRRNLAEKRRKGRQGEVTVCVAPMGAVGIGRCRPHKLFSCQRSKAPRGYSRPRYCRPPDPRFSFFSALRLGRVATIFPSHLAKRLGTGRCRRFTLAEYFCSHFLRAAAAPRGQGRCWPKRDEKGRQGDATTCVAPMGAAGVRLDRALAAAQFSLAGGSEPGAAIAARRTAAGRTHSFRFFRPAGLVKGPRSLQAIWQKNFGQEDASGSHLWNFSAPIFLPRGLEYPSCGRPILFSLLSPPPRLCGAKAGDGRKARKGAAGRCDNLRGANRRRGDRASPPTQTILMPAIQSPARL